MNLTSTRRFYFRTLPNLFIIFGLVFVVISFGPLLISETWFYLKEAKKQDYSLTVENGVQDSVFARFLSTRPIRIVPVNKDFSIVIERIDVNAPIVADVPVTDEKAYVEALKNGIAHAATSQYPSEDAGNVYLFAHASLNFFQLGRYSTAFNLLRKLDMNDRIHIFYRGRTYVYRVVNKEIFHGWNTYPLTRPVVEPILTLQTCDPPGTTLNRLVVTAKLMEVQD